MSSRIGYWADIEIDKGSHWHEELSWYTLDDDGVTQIPVNMTGYVVELQIRTTPEAPEPLLRLTTEDDTIVLNPTTMPQVVWDVIATDTEALPGRGGYLSIRYTIGAITKRWVEGWVSFTPATVRAQGVGP